VTKSFNKKKTYIRKNKRLRVRRVGGKRKKMFKLTKRGQITLGNLPTIALSFILAAAFFVAGFLILDGLSADLTAGSYAANSTAAIEVGMYNITSYIPTVGTLVGVGLLLAVIVGAFVLGRNRGWM
jgi:hypothetical protein